MIEEFKNLGKNHETPQEVGDEVFNTLDSMKLMTDIMDLFTVKFVKTKGELLNLSEEGSHSKDNESDDEKESH